MNKNIFKVNRNSGNGLGLGVEVHELTTSVRYVPTDQAFVTTVHEEAHLSARKNTNTVNNSKGCNDTFHIVFAYVPPGGHAENIPCTRAD